MPETDDIRAVVLQWIKKAENDLKNAVHTLKLGEHCPTDTVGFHAQQCVEKYLKGLLSFRGIDFPKTHNITELVALLPASTPIDLAPEDQELLTDYATVTRYPGDYDEIPLAEAKRAVKIARSVRRDVRRLIPREPARRRTKR
jgi:HEPN domain-containing protein